MIVYYAASGVWRCPGRPDLVADRSSLVAGTYKPSAVTTGAYLPTTQTLGATTYSTAGTAGSPIVHEGIRYEGRVSISSGYHRFINCEFVGPNAAPGDTDDNLIQASNASVVGLEFIDCTINAQVPRKTGYGFAGHDASFYRCDFGNTNDHVQVTNSKGYAGTIDHKLYFEACYFHDLTYFSPHPDGGNASHSDCFQISGGGGLTVFGCNLQGFYNPDVGQALTPPQYDASNNLLTGNRYYPSLTATSVLMTSPLTGAIGAITFDSNWIDGGAYALNFAGQTSPTGEVKIVNNRFGRGSRQGTIIALSSLPLTISRNTFEDNGAPANARTNG